MSKLARILAGQGAVRCGGVNTSPSSGAARRRRTQQTADQRAASALASKLVTQKARERLDAPDDSGISLSDLKAILRELPIDTPDRLALARRVFLAMDPPPSGPNFFATQARVLAAIAAVTS